MNKSFLLLTACLCIVRHTADAIIPNLTCGNSKASKHSASLTVKVKKDKNGEWLTTYHALKSDGSKSSPNDLILDLTQDVVECGDEETIHITGTIKAKKKDVISSENPRSKIKFHPRCGNNVAIINNGRTAKKLNMDEPLNGVAVTDRALERNELFEVRLDNKLTKFPHSLGIGVTSYWPATFRVPDHMWHLKTGSWMYYHGKSHHDGKVLIQNYGRDINQLQVGDRVGVMVTDSNTLHYFVNGLDQGPAANNMPSPVFGVFELYYNAAQGTIVDNTN